MTEISVGLKDGKKSRSCGGRAYGVFRRGSDVVCAGVSALVQALFYGFQEVLKEKGLRSAIDGEKTKCPLTGVHAPLRPETS